MKFKTLTVCDENQSCDHNRIYYTVINCEAINYLAFGHDSLTSFVNHYTDNKYGIHWGSIELNGVYSKEELLSFAQALFEHYITQTCFIQEETVK